MNQPPQFGDSIEGLAHDPELMAVWVIDESTVEDDLRLYNRAHRGSLDWCLRNLLFSQGDHEGKPRFLCFSWYFSGLGVPGRELD